MLFYAKRLFIAAKTQLGHFAIAEKKTHFLVNGPGVRLQGTFIR